MRVIRFSATLIFVALVITVFSVLAQINETRAARVVTANAASSVDSPPAKEIAQSSTPIAAAAPITPAGNSPISHYIPGPTETLVVGIVLLVGGGLLRRRRHTGEE